MTNNFVSEEINSRRTDSLNADERTIKQRWGGQSVF